MAHPFNEIFRYGSASLATESDLRRARMFEFDGPHVGYHGGRTLRLPGDAPLVTFGGAGSGKLRDLLGHVVCDNPGIPILVLDPRGELAAISRHMHAAHGEDAWHWNPTSLCGLPSNRCNPLDILTPNSPTLHADCAFLAEGLIPLTGGGTGRYFELRTREWVTNLLVARVERTGGTSLPDLYRVLGGIEGDRRAWADHLETMLASRFDGVRRTAAEMLTKQQDTPKEFGSILGEIYANLNFLDDPVLRASLETPDFSVSALVDPHHACKMFLNVPAEYLGIWSPVVRLFFTVAMLYKGRAPQVRRVLLLVDEAGQLGRFEALLRAFTFGRGAGIRAWAIFQDIGQITRNFGPAGVQGFLGSAQMRQFFGVRDYETARLVSSMLGTETLEYDDTLQQDAADYRRQEIVRQVLLGGADPFQVAQGFAHHRRNAEHRGKQSRPLMTPDEIMTMPEGKQLLFISGRDLKPVLADKHPYFTRREMAGKYLPNPYHPPVDSVPIATRLGTRRARVITEPVPRHLADYPQYRNGTWSYVEGFKPN